MTTITVSSGQYLATSGTSDVLYTSSGGSVISSYAGAGSDSVVVLSGGAMVVSSGATANNVTVSAGGKVNVASAATVSGANVYGSISVTAGAVVEATTVHNGGVLFELNNGETLTNAVTVDEGAEIVFAGLTSASNIVVTEGNTGLITVSSGTGANKKFESIQLASSSTYSVTNSGGKAAIIITCYAGGTEILTENGTVPVETIKASDKVVVRREGQDVLEPVTWVGSSTVDLSRHAHPELAAPIRIKAGALSEAVPARDLVVSPEHCMIVDGHCVPAKLLVNGTTIIREYPQAPFVYYHVELEHHGILIAEGAESESYLDTGNRAAFDNADEPRMLHPTFEFNADAERWQTDACAPLATTAEDVAPIWQGLADRAAALGFQLPAVESVEDPDLHLVVDGRRIEAISDRDARFVFAVPAGAKSVTLASRASIPADRMDPMIRDSRRIGVRVLWAAIRAGEEETILPADHPELRDGWHSVETYGPAPWRWTNGAATIPWQNVEGPAVLTIRCYPSGWYAVGQQPAAIAA